MPRNWYGELTEENIERVAELIRERLAGKHFSIASSSATNRPAPRLELKTGCKFEPSWTDGSKEPVRVMPVQPADWSKEPPARWLAFSAGHYFWMFFPRESTRFSFDYDGFEVEFSEPCGDLHKHYFRAEPVERDCGKCQGWHDLALPCDAVRVAEAEEVKGVPV